MFQDVGAEEQKALRDQNLTVFECWEVVAERSCETAAILTLYRNLQSRLVAIQVSESLLLHSTFIVKLSGY